MPGSHHPFRHIEAVEPHCYRLPAHPGGPFAEDHLSALDRAMPDMRFGFIDLHAGTSHVCGLVRPKTVDQHFGRECARGINWQRRPS
jgi:hypothetical protein